LKRNDSWTRSPEKGDLSASREEEVSPPALGKNIQENFNKRDKKSTDNFPLRNFFPLKVVK
jgi:hypothetical protein